MVSLPSLSRAAWQQRRRAFLPLPAMQDRRRSAWRLAVRDTDAQPCFRHGHRIKIGCRIVEVVPVRERCRQQPDAVLHLLRRQRVPR